MNWALRDKVLSDPHETLSELLHSMKIAVQEICLKTRSEEWERVLNSLDQTSSLVSQSPSTHIEYTRSLR